MRRMFVLAVAGAFSVWGFHSSASTEPGPGVPATVDDAAEDVLLGVLDAELTRTMNALSGQPQAPSYLSYRVDDRSYQSLVARHGALVKDWDFRIRGLHVLGGVADPHKDNTNLSHEAGADLEIAMQHHLFLALDDKLAALQHQIWSATDRMLGEAQQRSSSPEARETEANDSLEFSAAPAHRAIEPRVTLTLDTEAWRLPLKAVSSLLGAAAEIEVSTVSLEAGVDTSIFVDSDGARLREVRPWARVELAASTTAPDGEWLQFQHSTEVGDPARLPSVDALNAQAQSLRDDLIALRKAPVGEPYRGPVLLDGHAAARFVHNVLWGNVEGDRRRSAEAPANRQFAIGSRVLPDFIDIIDDPTLVHIGGVELAGHYRWDREGQPGARVTIVDRGVLRGLLMGRAPIAGFAHSNGHARFSQGDGPVPGVGLSNTLLVTSRPESPASLRQRLIEAARARNLPFGLRIEGMGLPLSDGTASAESFQLPVGRVWKVFVDGRPDALVRGLELVGAPIEAFSQVVATGDDPKVVSGRFGDDLYKEPLAAVSPSLLVGELALQRRAPTERRPTLLPRPMPSESF